MLEWLYQKIFIAIVPDAEMFNVKVAVIKKKKLVHKEGKTFGGENAYTQMVAYIQKYIEETPLYYIAVLNPEHNQGALRGCSMHDLSDVVSGAKTVCRNQSWLLYASIRELEGLKKRYAAIGLDFIFSPFSVLERFFGDKISGGIALYALAQKDSFTVALFDGGKLEYAHHYPLHAHETTVLGEDGNVIGFAVGVEEEDEPERGIDLDDIENLDDLDIIDELDDLSDIEDLDALEEIAEFSEDEPTIEEKRTVQIHADDTKEEMDRFGDDYSRFELVEKTLSRFYTGDQCHNRFIESVYIADAYGSGNELKRYLEEELFLTVSIRRIDIGDEVIGLAMSEEGL